MRYEWSQILTYKNNFRSLFKTKRLEVITECKNKVVDYLDVIFNLNDGTYKPYHKPDNKITYIIVQSNHPPNMKQLPKTTTNNDERTTTVQQLL